MDATKVNNRMHGVWAALVTPMTVTEKVDLDCLSRMVDYLIRQGLHGLIPLGSTGEFYALTSQERQDVVKVTLEVSSGRTPVFVGANGGSTQEVVYHCHQAEQLGAQGVMLAPPYYSRPTLDELFEHLRAVNNAIGIPIMLYNCPSRTGVDMTVEFVERLTELPNVLYIKESTGQMERVTQLIRTCGDRIGVFCGCDTIALACLMVGAVGWVGGVVNVLPGMHVKLYDLTVVKRDYSSARKLFYRMLPLLELAEQGGRYTQVVKAGCGLMGHPVGPPRSPLRPLGSRQLEEIRRLLIPLANDS